MMKSGRRLRSVNLAMVALWLGCAQGDPLDAAIDVDVDVEAREQPLRFSHAAQLSCRGASTLTDLVRCIVRQMPGADSGGFVAPTASQQADWRQVVSQMLLGLCDFGLPSSLSEPMRVRSFVDSGDGKRYCVLMEVADLDLNGRVDRGWGTFIVDPAATRELSQQAAHPISDSDTETEAALVFQATDSRSYLLCGAHRRADPGAGGCVPSHGPADCAHSTATMFYATAVALDVFYNARSIPHAQIQWHGMASTTCPSVGAYMSQGTSSVPAADAKISELARRLVSYNPAWDVGLTGAGLCRLNATDNVEGRYLNGVARASICSADAAVASGRFIHIEQRLDYRVAARWTSAILDTWP
jgi:hypothetical protein